MAYRQTAFAPKEWYHCYTRSIDSKPVFRAQVDYERFLQAMYLANSKTRIDRSNFRHPTHQTVLSIPRGDQRIAIGAYALMPNHFHILLQEKEVGGISTFMQKLGTSFAMYFNVKYKHVGNVFIKPFRAKHITNDRYLRRVVQYIHLNAADLFESDWKLGRVDDFNNLEKQLRAYPYTSIPDYYESNSRAETTILDFEAMNFLHEETDLMSTLEEAKSYYWEMMSGGDASGQKIPYRPWP